MTFVSERARPFAFACALLLAVPAWAADPAADVTVQGDGMVVGTILVPATEREVRAWIDDPVAMGGLSANVVSIESRVDGACQAVETRTRGLFRPLSFKSRRCPTSDGWLEQLVESEDFKSYESRWELRPVEGGTQVTLRIKSSVNLAVPAAVVESSTRRSLGDLLVSLVQNIVRRNPR